MEDNEQPPAPIVEASAPQVVERPLWELSRDEQRVLIITFVGGLASIIAGVCVVGGAIALARHWNAIHFGRGWLILFSAAFFLLAVFVVKSRDTWSTELKSASWYMWMLLLVPSAMLLLGWIGLAAGIH